MKKILIPIILIVLCLIPVSNVYSQDDKLRDIAQIPFEPFLTRIEDSEDPQASETMNPGVGNEALGEVLMLIVVGLLTLATAIGLGYIFR